MERICYVVMIDGNPNHVFIDEKQAERFCNQYSADYDEELSYFEAFLWTGKINQLEENEDGK